MVGAAGLGENGRRAKRLAWTLFAGLFRAGSAHNVLPDVDWHDHEFAAILTS